MGSSRTLPGCETGMQSHIDKTQSDPLKTALFEHAGGLVKRLTEHAELLRTLEKQPVSWFAEHQSLLYTLDAMSQFLALLYQGAPHPFHPTQEQFAIAAIHEQRQSLIRLYQKASLPLPPDLASVSLLGSLCQSRR